MNDKIELGLVYELIKKVIGSQSYILTDCISRVEYVKSKSKLSSFINTLAIDLNGTLYISEEFRTKFIPNETALTAFTMHEFFHSVLSDMNFMGKMDTLDEQELKLQRMAANIAFDCRINAVLYLLYEKSLDISKYFKAIYKDPELPPDAIYELLTSGNSKAVEKGFGEEAKKIYDSYYQCEDLKDFYRLYEIVLEYLKKNKDKYSSPNSVMLIGSHNVDEDGDLCDNDGNKILDKDGNPIAVEDLDNKDISKAISESLQEKEMKGEITQGKLQDIAGSGQAGGKKAGIGTKIYEVLVPVLENRIDKAIPNSLLKKIAINSIAKNIKLSATRRVAKWTTSPVVPMSFAKPDIMSIITGMDVLLWKHKRMATVYDPRLVPIYFDVSGSMTEYIPMVLDLILNIDSKIDHIWCFSTYVSLHTLDELKNRKIRTDGGTSFDAVLRHVNENNFTAIMVITDGECYVNEKRPECLNEAVTILTPNGTKNNWFSQTFEDRTHDIKEILEGKIA